MPHTKKLSTSFAKRRTSQFFLVMIATLWTTASMHATETFAETTPSARIISADAGVTAVLRSFGMEKQLVGIDVTSAQPEHGPALPVVGYHRQLSAEGLLALHPDLLIGSESMAPIDAVNKVELAGVKVLRLPQVQNAEGLLDNVKKLAAAVGQPAQAKNTQTQLTEKLSTLRASALPPGTQAMFLLSAGGRGLRAAGTGTGGHALIGLLGAQNIMTHSSYQPISAEAILTANPAVVLLAVDGQQQDTAQNLAQGYPTLTTLEAAKSGHILTVHSETLVAGLSVLTVDEALRLLAILNKSTAPMAQAVSAP